MSSAPVSSPSPLSGARVWCRSAVALWRDGPPLPAPAYGYLPPKILGWQDMSARLSGVLSDCGSRPRTLRDRRPRRGRRRLCGITVGVDTSCRTRPYKCNRLRATVMPVESIWLQSMTRPESDACDDCTGLDTTTPTQRISVDGGGVYGS